MKSLACIAALASLASAQQVRQFDPLEEVALEQRLGTALELDTPFRDERGARVRLADYFGERPVILALVYYECPMLCNLVLNGTVAALQQIDLQPGEDFELVVISIDPGETPELAQRKKANYLRFYERPAATAGLHFLVGDEPAIRAVADAVGFRYVYDERIDEYAHASGIIVATPAGELSRYFYGVDFPARDLRLGLVEASEGRIGSAVDQLLLLCFHYDPSTGKYGFAVMSLLRALGLLTLAALGWSMFVTIRRDRAGRRSP
jgi:protein SCO1/2